MQIILSIRSVIKRVGDMYPSKCFFFGGGASINYENGVGNVFCTMATRTCTYVDVVVVFVVVVVVLSLLSFLLLLCIVVVVCQILGCAVLDVSVPFFGVDTIAGGGCYNGRNAPSCAAPTRPLRGRSAENVKRQNAAEPYEVQK